MSEIEQANGATLGTVDALDMPQALWLIGRLIRAHARATQRYEVELPPVGSLVVEATHAWRARRNWPEPSGVGWVERVEAEDPRQPVSPPNSRVVIRRLDDGTPQPWVNASFLIAPTAVTEMLRGRSPDAL